MRYVRFMHLQAATECTDALKLPAVRPYFTASVFLQMSKDLQGTISIPCFHHYIVRKNAMLQTVCALLRSFLDPDRFQSRFHSSS